MAGIRPSQGREVIIKFQIKSDHRPSFSPKMHFNQITHVGACYADWSSFPDHLLLILLPILFYFPEFYRFSCFFYKELRLINPLVLYLAQSAVIDLIFMIPSINWCKI